MLLKLNDVVLLVFNLTWWTLWRPCAAFLALMLPLVVKASTYWRRYWRILDCRPQWDTEKGFLRAVLLLRIKLQIILLLDYHAAHLVWAVLWEILQTAQTQIVSLLLFKISGQPSSICLYVWCWCHQLRIRITYIWMWISGGSPLKAYLPWKLSQHGTTGPRMEAWLNSLRHQNGGMWRLDGYHC